MTITHEQLHILHRAFEESYEQYEIINWAKRKCEKLLNPDSLLVKIILALGFPFSFWIIDIRKNKLNQIIQNAYQVARADMLVVESIEQFPKELSYYTAFMDLYSKAIDNNAYDNIDLALHINATNEHINSLKKESNKKASEIYNEIAFYSNVMNSYY